MNLPAIDIDFPDIRRWAVGNTGCPYVWKFSAASAGPHVCITALVHGNEVCGAIAADTLLNALHADAGAARGARDARATRIARGTVSVVFANVAAYFAFDAAKPYESRCIDEDFNRVWHADTLDGTRQSKELYRARELRAHYDSVDHLLDLHSMLEPAPAIALAGDTAKGLALARAIGTPQNILVDSGHAAGKRLRDYAGFADATSPKSALLVECGQHWERSVGDVACDVMWRFLHHFKMLDTAPNDANEANNLLPEQRVIDISHVVTVTGEKFRWVRPLAGLEIIPRLGTLLATDGETEIRTPHDDAIMVMPVPSPKVGQTAVRIGCVRDENL
jgi:predicted deacylase